MPSFEKRLLPPPTRVCARLRAAREATKISLAEMARRTHISPKYLEALETCRFDEIPFGMVYQKNFLKRYAAVLHLPPQTFLDQFIDEETTGSEKPTVTGIRQKKRLSNIPFMIRSASFVLVVLSLVAYLGMEVKKSIDPPSLTLFSPPDGFVTGAQSLTVRGETEQEVELFINGKTIIPGNGGVFAEQLYLSPGINTITVSAKRKHGKTQVATRHVIYKEAKDVSYNK